jgi:hypothetical protein
MGQCISLLTSIPKLISTQFNPQQSSGGTCGPHARVGDVSSEGITLIEPTTTATCFVKGRPAGHAFKVDRVPVIESPT